jgi:REP element-mobilizing transposase RayT
MPTDILPLTYGSFYHIYNRGNNRENIFPQKRNYEYFMELWWKHTSPIAETWAYCLLRNHFHAVVYIKDREDLTGLTGSMPHATARAGKEASPLKTPGDLSGLNSNIKEPSQYFSNFFNAYARGLNIAVQNTTRHCDEPQTARRFSRRHLHQHASAGEQSPKTKYRLIVKEIASPPKNKGGGSQ